jgi:hypothetical protein
MADEFDQERAWNEALREQAATIRSWCVDAERLVEQLRERTLAAGGVPADALPDLEGLSADEVKAKAIALATFEPIPHYGSVLDLSDQLLMVIENAREAAADAELQAGK